MIKGGWSLSISYNALTRTNYILIRKIRSNKYLEMKRAVICPDTGYKRMNDSFCDPRFLLKQPIYSIMQQKNVNCEKKIANLAISEHTTVTFINKSICSEYLL